MPVTLKTIADRVGVSVQAVSCVMNRRTSETRISPERSAEILRVAQELNYVPNASARAMRSKMTRQIGVLVPVPADRLGAGFHPRGLESVMGINAALEPTGNIMVLIPVTGDDTLDRVESRVFRERLLDGLILLEDVPAIDAERATALVSTAVHINGNDWAERDCLRRDEVAVGRLVAEELHQLGYRKIVYVDKVHREHYSFADRFAGLSGFAAGHGMAVEHVAIQLPENDVPLPDCLRRLDRSVAVVAADVSIVRMLQAVFGELGVRPGHDFALASCDSTNEFYWTFPTLARVRFDRFGLGRRAAEWILRRIASPKAVLKSETFMEGWIPGSTALPARPS